MVSGSFRALKDFIVGRVVAILVRVLLDKMIVIVFILRILSLLVSVSSAIVLNKVQFSIRV